MPNTKKINEIEKLEPEFPTEELTKDVNSSKLGVFSSKDFSSQRREIENDETEEKPIKEKSGEIKKSNSKLDFEKFTRTKTKNQPTSSFGLKVDHWLRTPKILKAIWMWIISLLIIILITSITSLALVSQVMSSSAKGPHNFPYISSLAQATYAFSYMGLIFPLIPIMFLVTSWFVGINGVHVSRMFHYVLWSFFLFALFCIILELIFTIDILINCWTFHPLPI